MNPEPCGIRHETCAGRNATSPCTVNPALCPGDPAACPPECHSAGVPPALADVLARFAKEAHAGRCNTGRYEARYWTWGEGPALVMVPGLGSDARAFVPLAARLKTDCKCILYDLPTGQNDNARLRNYDLDGLSADTVALLDHLQVPSATVIGWSFGSMIGLHAMARNTGPIQRAVLLGGFARRRLAPAEVLLARLLRYSPGRMRRLPFHDKLMYRSHHGAFAEQPDDLWQFFLDRCGSAPIKAVAHRALILHRTDLREQLAQVHGPVLIVTGDCDPLVPRAAALELRQHLPQSVHVELADCGHFAALSHTDLLAEVIRGFLSERESNRQDAKNAEAREE